MFYHPTTQTKIPEGTAFVLDGAQYPANWLNLTTPEEKSSAGIFDLVEAPLPTFDPLRQIVVDGGIKETEAGWSTSWAIVDLPEETILNNQMRVAEKMQEDIIKAMEVLFDKVAQAKNYDNRVTCALRAGYPGPFQSEGTAFAHWMDDCNYAAFVILQEVKAGTRPLPTSVEEALTLLPPFTAWEVN